MDSSQENHLRSEEGGAKQLAMKILTKVGDAVGADSLVPIKSAHVLAHYSSIHEAGIEVLELFANAGGKLRQVDSGALFPFKGILLESPLRGVGNSQG